MRYILLDITTVLYSFLPYLFTAAVGVITYFFKQSQAREKIRLDKVYEDSKKVYEDNEKDHKNFMEYIKALERVDEEIKKMLNDVNIQILKDINALTVKLAEYKRDIRN